MFDISCLFTTNTPEFATIQTDAFNIWSGCPGNNPLEAGIAQVMKNQFNLTVDGQHYFVQKDNSLSAVWDLTSSGPFAGNPNAIVFAHPVNTASSPDGPDNIKWVELKKDSGGLANTIYRVNTVKGLPPTSVSFSVNWCLSCSINLNFFAVYARRCHKCQVCHEILYVYTDVMVSVWPLLTCACLVLL
jgi:hypothetical protein